MRDFRLASTTGNQAPAQTSSLVHPQNYPHYLHDEPEIVWRLVEEIVVGLLTGFAGAIGFWAFMIRVFPPRLAFYSSIKETPNFAEIAYHQIKLENVGRRNIIDVHVIVRLVVHYAGRRKFIDLKLDTEYIPYIKPGYPSAKVIRIHPESNNEFTQFPFVDEIQKRAEKGNLVLTDLLSLDKPATVAPGGMEIEVIVFASDQHSLTRKIFISPVYRNTDIRQDFGEQIVAPQLGYFATVFGRSPELSAERRG